MCAKRVQAYLGRWQFKRYNERKGRMETLQKEIGSLMNVHGNAPNTEGLHAVREELACLYNVEKVYWAQGSWIKWLRECDRNTRFFHV